MAYVRQLTADGTVAAKFHDLQFPASLATATGRSFDADALASAAAPTLGICQWQGGAGTRSSGCTSSWAHAASDRRRTAADGWQVIPMLLGLASTGKSTIVSDVVARFFEEDCYAYIVNNMEKQFGWSSVMGKYCWLAPEVKADFAQHTDQARAAAAAPRRPAPTHHPLSRPSTALPPPSLDRHNGSSWCRVSACRRPSSTRRASGDAGHDPHGHHGGERERRLPTTAAR